MNLQRWGAAAASLVTVLALLVAPVCGMLCARQACSQGRGAAAEAPCHFSAVEQGNALHFHATHICGARELQAADLTSTNLRSSLQAQRLRIFAGSFDLLWLGLLRRMENYGAASSPYTPPPEHASSPAATVVLRI